MIYRIDITNQIEWKNKLTQSKFQNEHLTRIQSSKVKRSLSGVATKLQQNLLNEIRSF